MKKIRIFALMGVIALTSALAFTSCKKDKNAPENVTTGTNEVVKTQFSISIPTTGGSKAKGPRHMQGTKVQLTTGDFTTNGITNIYLYPYATTGVIQPSDAKIGSVIDLTELTPEALTSGANENARKYSNVAIPVGTASFLFYAKSGASGTESQKGKTEMPNWFKADLVPSEIVFTPSIRYNAADINTNETAILLKAYLTSIAQTKVGDDGYWGATTNEGLKNLYDSLTVLKAGSSANVQVIVSDLYSSVINNDDPLSEAIVASINNSTYVESVVAKDAADFATKKENGQLVVLKSTLLGFPGNVNLPDGAAALTWNNVATPASVACSFLGRAVPGLELGAAQTTATNKFAYPAELLYGVNSTIHTNDHAVLNNYDGSGWETWVSTNNPTTGYASASRTVLTSTRSVAIDKQINYGVGRFDVKVRLGDESSVAVGRSDKSTGEHSSVPIPTGGYKLTGVLVGSQNPIDYMFHKVADASDNYVIYDNDIVSNAYKITFLS